jgi:hypothetical protein
MGNALVFYSDKDVSPSLWAPLFSAIQEDLAHEDYGSADQSLDRNPSLLRSTNIHPGEEFSRVVEVILLGRCDVAQQAYRPLKPGPLGWVLRVHGEIQPYIYIDCTRLAQVLNPATLGLSNDERTRAMTQAIAHVLVHEWIHITTQNAGHTEHGITQATLTIGQLIAEPSQLRTSASNGAENHAAFNDQVPVPAEN